MGEEQKEQFKDKLSEREEIPENVLLVPKVSREGAIHDLYDSVSSLRKKMENGESVGPIKYRTKKSRTFHPIRMEAKDVRINGQILNLFPKFFTGNPRKNTGICLVKDKGLEKLADAKIKGSKLVHKDGYWHLNISYEKRISVEEPEKHPVAFDPGIATFLTSYSSDKVKEYKQPYKKISKLNAKKDLLHKLIDSGKVKKKRCLKRIESLERKLKYTRDDFHYLVIRDVMQSFNHILLPSFDTQKLTRKYAKESNRSLYNMSHYMFRKRLIEKCNISPYHKYHIVSEAYTSKTCTKCGNVKKRGELKLTNRIYNCCKCKVSLGRDVNAARNIYLKNENLL